MKFAKLYAVKLIAKWFCQTLALPNFHHLRYVRVLCICVCAFMFTCVHACIVCMYVQGGVSAYVYVCLCVFVCMHDVCMHLCTFLCVHVLMCIFILTCVYVWYV